MRNIKETGLIIVIVCSLVSAGLLNAQVLSNNEVIANISAENPFFDASTNFDLSVDPSSSGKGLVFARVDLTSFTFNTSILDGVIFPSAYDGMIVYNVGTGNTPSGQGVVVSAVTPGYYYFKNPNAEANPWGITEIDGGEWIRITDELTIPEGDFDGLRADGSPWIADSVTLVSGDVVLTQTTDSIYFNVDWDTLGAYLDTNYTGDNLGDHVATENLQMSGFWISNDGGDEGVFVDSDGRVGIGISTPGDKLHVAGGNGGITISGENPAITVLHGGYALGVSTPTSGAWSNSAGVNDLVLRSPNGEAVMIQSGDGTADIFIAASHDVGIGTDSPGAKMDVNGTLIVRDVPVDAAPESVLTIDAGQLKKFSVLDYTPLNAFWADSASWAGEVHWDSITGIPADIANGDQLGFQRLRADASAWLSDSVTLVQGTNVTLTQTGDSITISTTVSDDKWTRSGNYVRTYSTSDSVGVGVASPTTKLDVDGGVRVRGGAALPTASASLRGTIFTLQGGAGVDDKIYICGKNSAGTYVWILIGRGD